MILLNAVLLIQRHQSRVSLGKEKLFNGKGIFILLQPYSSDSVMLRGTTAVMQLVRLSGLQSSQPTAAKSPDCNLANHCVFRQRHCVSLFLYPQLPLPSFTLFLHPCCWLFLLAALLRVLRGQLVRCGALNNHTEVFA